MSIQSKFRTASTIYAESGPRALVLKTAITYGGSFIEDQYLDLCGFERYTGEEGVEVIYLPASDVEYLDDFGFVPQKGKDAVGGVVRGKWDLLRRPFEDSMTYKTFYNVFINGSDWSATEKYKWALMKIQSGDHAWGSESVEQLENRIDRYENLYESIRDSGFKSQLELYRQYGRNKSDYQRRMGDVLIPNELRVAIGRNGEIIRTDGGLHRTSILKILKRSTHIPAIIQFKHTNFQEDLPYEKSFLDDTHELVDYSVT